VYKPGSDIDLVLKGKNLNMESLNRIGLAFDNLLPVQSTNHRHSGTKLISPVKPNQVNDSVAS